MRLLDGPAAVVTITGTRLAPAAGAGAVAVQLVADGHEVGAWIPPKVATICPLEDMRPLPVITTC